MELAAGDCAAASMAANISMRTMHTRRNVLLLAIHLFLVALESDARHPEADHDERGKDLPVSGDGFVFTGTYNSKGELREVIGRHCQRKTLHDFRQEHERHPESA